MMFKRFFAIFLILQVITSINSFANNCERDLAPLFFSPYVEVTENNEAHMRFSAQNGPAAKFVNAITKALSPLLGYNQLAEPLQRLDQMLNDPNETRGYYSLMVEAFRMQVTMNWHSPMMTIPKEGSPLIIVANHPLNGAEGPAIAHAMAEYRKDIKIVMTDALKEAPGMAENAFMLQVHGGNSPEARAHRAELNRPVYQAIDDYVKNGGAIVVFPAGEVSDKEHPTDDFAYDKGWKKGVHEIYLKVPEAVVLPVYVEGAPSDFYQWVKHHISETAAAALHIADFMDHVKKPINLQMGRPYGPRELSHFNEQEFLGLLRADVYAMRPQHMCVYLKDCL